MTPTPLGRKQSLDIHAWNAARATINDVVTPEHLQTLIARTITEIRAITANRRATYGWSGGKDSIALGWLMEQAGIHDSLLVISDLEYPSFLNWVEENRPDHLTIANTGQNHEYLRKNPHMLFPHGERASRWFTIVQHRGQRDYFRANNVDLLALGRRRADGNQVGPNGGKPYTNKSGITNWCPIADWTHEEVIALLDYADLDLPPIYSGPRGFQVGTGPWAARAGTSTDPNSPTYGWHETYQVDPTVVHTAANENIPGAADYLRKAE